MLKKELKLCSCSSAGWTLYQQCQGFDSQGGQILITCRMLNADQRLSHAYMYLKICIKEYCFKTHVLPSYSDDYSQPQHINYSTSQICASIITIIVIFFHIRNKHHCEIMSARSKALLALCDGILHVSPPTDSLYTHTHLSFSHLLYLVLSHSLLGIARYDNRRNYTWKIGVRVCSYMCV